MALSQADFGDYWRARYAAWSARRVRVEAVEAENADCGPTELRIEADAASFGAWLTRPGEGEAVTRVVIFLHGYDGRARDTISHPPLRDTAALWPCLHGLGELSRVQGVPDEAPGHVLHGIEAVETYIHGACVEDVWSTITAATQLFPLTRSIHLVGPSFGRGIATLAVPWDRRVSSLSVEVPSFGDHRARLATASIGSAAAVQERYRTDPSIIRTLDYFDAATAARFLAVPTLRRRTPSCLPSGRRRSQMRCPTRCESSCRTDIRSRRRRAMRCRSPPGTSSARIPPDRRPARRGQAPPPVE